MERYVRRVVTADRRIFKEMFKTINNHKNKQNGKH